MRGRAFAFLSVLAVLAAGASFGSSGVAMASRSGDVPSLRQQVADCESSLAKLQATVAAAKAFLALGSSGKIFITPALSAQLTESVIHNRRAATDTARRCQKKRTALKTAGSGTTTTEATQPAVGAFPGGTATKLTLTLAGKTVVTDLKPNKQTPDHTSFAIQAKSDGTELPGAVSLDGSLPPGWELVVSSASDKSGVTIRLRGSGNFSVPPPFVGFAAGGGVSAYICPATSKWIIDQACQPAAQALIDISWSR